MKLTNSSIIILISLLIVILGLIGCRPDFGPPIIANFDLNAKINSKLKTVENPIFCSAECNQKNRIAVWVPKPYPSNPNFYNKNIEYYHFLRLYMNSVLIDSVRINNEFPRITKMKLIEIKLPSSNQIKELKGTLKLELLSKNELITTYECEYYYAQDGVEFEYVERISPQLRLGDTIPNIKYDKDFTFKKQCNLVDDIVRSTTIEKKSDHYEYRSKAEGNYIYKVINGPFGLKHYKKLTKVPKLPDLVTKIPLDIELEERSGSRGCIGISKLDTHYLNKTIMYRYEELYYGNKYKIKFDKCQRDTLERKEIVAKFHDVYGFDKIYHLLN